MVSDPFALPLPGHPIARCFAKPLQVAMANVLGLTALSRVYRRLEPAASHNFLHRVIAALDIEVTVEAGGLARVPARGPLVLAANHPTGALDGLAVASALCGVRPDVRLLANHMLARIPEMHEHAFFVDPFGGPSAGSRSLAGLRAAHLWLRRGGALVVFPAGEVAHRLEDGVPIESAWEETMARLAQQTGAQILPVAVSGRNSRWFYRLGRLHAAIRTALLPRELLRACRTRVRVAVGQPISPVSIRDALSTREIVARTRTVVQAMTGVLSCAGDGTVRFAERDATMRFARRDDTACLGAEVACLDASACLVSSGPFRVFVATAEQIPHVLREIGRLRARAFSIAGEGNGAEVDLDRFDRDYHHLFVWDANAGRVAGAYRLGLTDRLVAARGVSSLYTQTLFAFGEPLIEQLPPAIELGRSFVAPEYQRHHQPLALLWKGIGQFVLRHPHYRVLFGPVSVSARYCDESRRFLASALQQQCGEPRLAAYVTPRHPLAGKPLRSAGRVPDDAALDDCIASIEPDGKGLPVLLRQYLRLGARVLGWSEDPNFGGVLDALMLVDLVQVAPARLAHYLGREGMDAYLARHREIPLSTPGNARFHSISPSPPSSSDAADGHVRPAEAAA